MASLGHRDRARRVRHLDRVADRAAGAGVEPDELLCRARRRARAMPLTERASLTPDADAAARRRGTLPVLARDDAQAVVAERADEDVVAGDADDVRAPADRDSLDDRRRRRRSAVGVGGRGLRRGRGGVARLGRVVADPSATAATTPTPRRRRASAASSASGRRLRSGAPADSLSLRLKLSLGLFRERSPGLARRGDGRRLDRRGGALGDEPLAFGRRAGRRRRRARRGRGRRRTGSAPPGPWPARARSRRRRPRAGRARARSASAAARRGAPTAAPRRPRA